MTVNKADELRLLMQSKLQRHRAELKHAPGTTVAGPLGSASHNSDGTTGSSASKRRTAIGSTADAAAQSIDRGSTSTRAPQTATDPTSSAVRIAQLQLDVLKSIDQKLSGGASVARAG